MPGADLQSSIGTELSYLLPRDGVALFEKLFADLEAQRAQLGIASYGASVSTLEEVFLKVGRHDDEEGAASDGGDPPDVLLLGNSKRDGNDNDGYGGDDDVALLIPERLAPASSVDDAPTKKQKPSSWRQFRAMLVKRIKNSMRNKWTLGFQMVPPLLFTLLALWTAGIQAPVVTPPGRSLGDLSKSYGKHTIWTASAEPLNQNTSASLNASLDLNSGSNASLFTNLSSLTTEDAATEGTVALFLARAAGSTGKSQDVFNFYRSTPMLLELRQPGEPEAARGSVGWFNGEAYHSVAESLGVIDSTIFAEHTGATITTENQPLPKSLDEQISDSQDSFAGFNLAFSILFGMAPMAASFLIFLVQETESKAKHVQFVSGVTATAYWLSAFLWDYFCYLFPTFGCFILFQAFGTEAYVGAQFNYALGLFLLYGLAVIPMIYISSYLFHNPSTAFVRMTLFNIITGLAAMMAVTILSVIPSTQKTADALRKAFLFLPNYCFGQGLSDMFTNHETASLLKKILESYEADSPHPTSFFVNSRTLVWGASTPPLRGFSAPCQCPLASAASYLIYADVRKIDDSSHS